jgi:hypothetical protein
LDDWREYCGSQGFRAANPQFSDFWIRQKLDGPYALFQFIEGCQASLEHRTTVHRRFGTPRTTVEKPNADGVLKVGDDFGDG